MKKTLIAAAVASVCAASAFAQEAAPASPYTVTANVGVVSDYLFRGISQTAGKPAIQGGVDLSHQSGLYVGTWLSSISWISDSIQFAGGGDKKGSYPTEIDVYAGFKNSFAEDFGYDVGVITYNYPGSGREGNIVAPFTAEVYGALSWKFLSIKYSQAVSKNFVAWGATNGSAESKGSGYLELNANYDLGDGWGVSGHVGHQKVKDFNSVTDPGALDASYTDWNIGVTKDVGFGVVGLKYSDTNAKTCGDAVAAYCWGPNGTYDAAKGKALLSFTKTF